MQVVAARKDKRVKGDDGNKSVMTNLEVRSPLVQAKGKNLEKILENLNPFWAVLRCPEPHSCPTMELETQKFMDLGCQASCSKYPKSVVQFSVEIPIMRNKCHIGKGEILTLPFDFDVE